MIAYEQKPWLKHYGDVPPEIVNPAVPLTQIIERWKDDADRVAVVLEDREVSYATLWSDVNRVAEGLKRMGIRPNDRVALLMPNSLAFVQAYFGILRAGAVVVALNPLYTPAELAVMFLDAQPSVLIAPPQAAGKIPAKVPWPVVMADMNNVREQEEQGQAAYPDAHCFTDWLALPEISDPPAIDPQTHLALLQYTGGTTGVPKGAMLTHANLWSNAEQARLWAAGMLSAEQDTVLVALPLFHVYAMTVGMNLGLLIGARLVLMPRFQPEPAAQWIVRTRPTLFPGAPTLYVAMEQYAVEHAVDLTSVRLCISGSAPLPSEVQERFKQLMNGRIVEGYGLTEASPVTHCQPLWPVDAAHSGIGLPFPSTEVRIVDPAGQDVAVGESGELLIRGPQVMQGYWNKPDDTVNALADGWLRTGDIAAMDDEGYFVIQDRKKDMIICSGFNVYPREVEEVLYQCEGVLEVCVVGVPDAYRGETVKAYVVPREGQTVRVENLQKRCEQNLAPYKRPRIYAVVDHLPKSAIGKILRRELARES